MDSLIIKEVVEYNLNAVLGAVFVRCEAFSFVSIKLKPGFSYIPVLKFTVYDDLGTVMRQGELHGVIVPYQHHLQFDLQSGCPEIVTIADAEWKELHEWLRAYVEMECESDHTNANFERFRLRVTIIINGEIQ